MNWVQSVLAFPAFRIFMWIAGGLCFVSFVLGRWSASRGSQVVVVGGSSVVRSSGSGVSGLVLFLRFLLFACVVVGLLAYSSPAFRGWVVERFSSYVPEEVVPCPR